MNGTLWRVVPSDSGRFVGEERDAASKQARFFCLDQFSGKVLWEKLTLDDPWWIGIEAIHREVVLLHGFSTPDLPEHKMITAVDLLSGKILWSNGELSFIGAVDDLVFASRSTPLGTASYTLDIRTGQILHEAQDADARIRRTQRPAELSIENEITHPTVVQPDDHPAMIINPHHHSGTTVGHVEAIEVDDLIIFSYHEKTSQSADQQIDLRNILKVVHKTNGDVLFEDVLNAHCSVPTPESFFVQHGMLYFVKERSELTAIQLPGSYAEE